MDEASDATGSSCPEDATAVLQAWAADMVTAVKSDAGDRRHLLSVGTVGGSPASCGTRGDEWKALTTSPASMGLIVKLSAMLQRVQAAFDAPLPRFNGDDSWEVPTPAVFVVDRTGVVRLASANVDYRNVSSQWRSLGC